MKAAEQQVIRRERLLQGLFWGGMALAPLAVLVLLFGQSAGAQRVAITLSVLTIVLLAISIGMRPSVEMLRVDIEHRILDELERVRVRSREDIATAARNTHRALTDQIQAVSDLVAEMRRQLDDVRAQYDEVQAGIMLAQAGHLPHHVSGGGPGVVRHTETVQVTRRTTTVGGDERRGTVYGSRASLDGEWREDGPEAHSGAGDRWASAGRDDGRSPDLGEAHWEATFRSLSREPERPALPRPVSDPPSRYLDDAGPDREPVRVPGRDRPEREYGGRHDRDFDHDREPWERGERSHGDPDRDYRGRDVRDRGYRDRDRSDRDYRDRDYRDRDYEDRDYRERDYGDRHHPDRDRRPRDGDGDGSGWEHEWSHAYERSYSRHRDGRDMEGGRSRDREYRRGPRYEDEPYPDHRDWSYDDGGRYGRDAGYGRGDRGYAPRQRRGYPGGY